MIPLVRESTTVRTDFSKVANSPGRLILPRSCARGQGNTSPRLVRPHSCSASVNSVLERTSVGPPVRPPGPAQQTRARHPLHSRPRRAARETVSRDETACLVDLQDPDRADVLGVGRHIPRLGYNLGKEAKAQGRH